MKQHLPQEVKKKEKPTLSKVSSLGTIFKKQDSKKVLVVKK